MTWEFRTLIVTADDAPLARDVAVTLAPTGGQHMWTTPLAPTSDGPPTHYVSTGYIDPRFAEMVPCTFWAIDEDGAWVPTRRDPGNPVLVWQACVAGGLVVTQPDIDGLFARSDVSEQQPFVAMARLGLTMAQTGIADG
jgi:hypothetical protein